MNPRSLSVLAVVDDLPHVHDSASTMADETIRPTRAADMGAVQALAVAAHMFPAEEVGFLAEQFAASERGESPDSHWLVLERAGSVLGAAYYAPEPYADRMWNLYFLVVSPEAHGQGLGKRLVEHVEDTLRAHGEAEARVLIVETSSTAQYAGTRDFYRRLGYVEEATIRQFYGPEDDKVVFWKSLV